MELPSNVKLTDRRPSEASELPRDWLGGGSVERLVRLFVVLSAGGPQRRTALRRSHHQAPNRGSGQLTPMRQHTEHQAPRRVCTRLAPHRADVGILLARAG